MFSSMGPVRWGRLAAMSLVVAAAGVVSGCATPTVAARVTSFQQWPQGVEGQTYRFQTANAGQKDNLEYQAFQDMVRAGIGPTGLVEAQAGKDARFLVSFTYGSKQTQIMVRRAYDPYFYGGYGGPYFGPRGWRGPWGPAPFWGPDWVDVPAVAFRNSLNLQIFDTARGNAEVYRSTAYIVSQQEDILRAMPYLVRAIFDNFPGNNGSEREVEFPLNH
ncbi:DUF4136 domain-containing protein [Bordetella genomosp. 12]|uniref:DUF4136 domain-containing protein n=1 Tax=Bordetella genomosp. 12 TaxID=463035 RepID=A0A261VJZ5_9BORD|nr:DUF4136 domain-containing protein [Bordetella genomosp. 12]OZI74399.1 hypothetical protein CAL22_07910 [Bordetella genomosp. 12]